MVKVSFQFGLTADYGSRTPVVRIAPAVTAQSVAQAASGRSGGTTFHCRVSVQSDFGTFTGAGQTFTTH